MDSEKMFSVVMEAVYDLPRSYVQNIEKRQEGWHKRRLRMKIFGFLANFCKPLSNIVLRLLEMLLLSRCMFFAESNCLSAYYELSSPSR